MLFGFTDTPAAMVFAIALAISSLIPGGSGIVLALAAVVAYTQQDITHAIIILVVGHVITLSGDYIIKPVVTGAKSHAPFLLVLLSILGGVEVMGLIGLIAGPVIVLMLYGMVADSDSDISHRL
jgi:predicted PurR-regulated permease PerM